MKKILFFSLLAGILIFSGSWVFSKTKTFPKENNKKVLVNYYWYRDASFTLPTGTCSEINVEVNRLTQLYPTNTFTTEVSPMYNEYEYGYSSLRPTVIIYSDR